MCANRHIPSDQGDIVVDLRPCNAITIGQGEAKVVVGKKELTELADKLYFLDQAFQADLEEPVEALCRD